jgi:hypothetical protein
MIDARRTTDGLYLRIACDGCGRRARGSALVSARRPVDIERSRMAMIHLTREMGDPFAWGVRGELMCLDCYKAYWRAWLQANPKWPHRPRP